MNTEEHQEFKQLKLQWEQAYLNICKHESNFHLFMDKLEGKYDSLNETRMDYTTVGDVINQYKNEYFINNK